MFVFRLMMQPSMLAARALGAAGHAPARAHGALSALQLMRAQCFHHLRLYVPLPVLLALPLLAKLRHLQLVYHVRYGTSRKSDAGNDSNMCKSCKPIHQYPIDFSERLAHS